MANAKYLLRDAATQCLNDEEGLKVGPTGLANMASDGKGPRYSIINGRACYTREDLSAWVREQATQPTLIQRRREKAAAEAAQATA